MAAVSYFRASDRQEFIDGLDNGFIERKRTVKNPILHFSLLGLMVILGTGLIVYYKSPLGCFVAVCVGGIINIIAQQMEALKKMLRATEFLSALFASSLSKGYRFAAIVTQGGEVVYTNRSFQTMFPQLCAKPNFSVSEVFEAAKIPAQELPTLTSLMSNADAGALAVTMTDGNATVINATIEVTPIERPSGFLLVRAK